MSYQFDHRQLADEMEIFFFEQNSIGAGLPIWLPNGVIIRDELEKFIRELERQQGYQRVVSPHLAKAELYEQSGHLKFFKEQMFPPLKWPEDQCDYYLKPMNCPHHHKVFSSRPRSYRQLPLRIAEYGQVYRYEHSGALRGLSRVRGLCQNDAHIYIDPSQALVEVMAVLELHESCYKILELKNYRYRLSKHDPKQEDNEENGAKAQWIQCEGILRQALQAKNLPFFEADGEAAFYGPKIDVQMRIGASGEESIASIQLDFLSARRFDLGFVASSGRLEKPWIIHRAPLGSHERFVAMLLEYYDGQLPGWLSPIQIYLLPLSEKDRDYAVQLAQDLLQASIRAVVDENDGSLSKKVRLAHKFRPFAKLVIGGKERESESFLLQLRNESLPIKRSELIPLLKKFIERGG